MSGGAPWRAFRHPSSSGHRPLLLVTVLRLLTPSRAGAEDHADLKYERYLEDDNRIEVGTFSVLAEKSLTASLSARGEFVHDVISGATPTGGPPLPGSDQVPLARMDDTRYAGSLELSQRWGRHTLRPQVAYSTESDYESLGLALNYSLDLNEKNTTLTAGFAHNFDRVLPGNSWLTETEDKDTSDFLLGITQLLGPTTILTANLTVGFSDGYLSDPYKGVRFEWYPFYETLFPEKRPDERDRQVGYLSLTHGFRAIDGSLEASYRIYHDTFGIWSHTAGFGWFQKVGKHLVLNPFVRYYTQSEADFYGISFPGDPSLSQDGVPEFYSSDYRLSSMNTWTAGLKAVVNLGEHVVLDAAYKRYVMEGNDDITSASAYPSANILTGGISVWF